MLYRLSYASKWKQGPSDTILPLSCPRQLFKVSQAVFAVQPELRIPVKASIAQMYTVQSMAASNQFEKSPTLWLIVAVIVGVNLWYDYRHPGWLILDAIIVIAVIFKMSSRNGRGPRSRNGRSEN